MPVSPDSIMSLEGTSLNQSCRAIYKWTLHKFTLHPPQQNEPRVKTILDLWVQGTQSLGCRIKARALDFLFHEYSQADRGFFVVFFF